MKETTMRNLNTIEEFSVFMKTLKREVLPELKENGVDITTDYFTVIQPYSNDHYIQVGFHESDGERMMATNVGDDLNEIETDAYSSVIYLEEKEGVLDVFKPDKTDEEFGRLQEIVDSANKQKMSKTILEKNDLK